MSTVYHQPPLALDLEKQSSPAHDPSAFVLSLRSEEGTGEDLNILHSYGIHRVPHIGVYGSNYTLALPIVLLSLPPSLSCLRQLPSDILNALDIDLTLLYNSALDKIAKELVQRILVSAYSKCQSSFWQFREQEEAPVPEAATFEIKSSDFEEECDEMLMDVEGTIRHLAKKLVRKVLHTATQRIEGRRSSIELEYIIASTKKLKLDTTPSPLATPPRTITPPSSPNLIQELLTKNEFGGSLLSVDSGVSLAYSHGSLLSGSASSPSLTQLEDQEEQLRKQRKRRQRSKSHDANSMRELNTAQKYQPINEPISENTEETSPTENFGQLQEEHSIAGLIVDLTIMSIEESKEEGVNEEEDYIILESITKAVDCKEEEEYIILESVTKALDTYPKSPEVVSFTVGEVNRLDPVPLLHPDSHTIPNMEYYIMIHSCPERGLCQKFLCDNTDEINLLFHCWLYKDIPVDESIIVQEQVDMGVFSPEGVLPVHLDLEDGGVPFFYLEPRSVCIHRCCFSPENAQLQLQEEVHYHIFFSVAHHGDRRVVTLHIIPAHKATELLVRNSISQCNTLRDLLACFNDISFPISQRLQHFLSPLLLC